MIKRYIPRIAAVVIICLISSMGFIKKDVAFVSAEADTGKTVIIDPGHGGFDGGAVATDGTLEKDINLNISLFLEKMLTFCGYNVILTRESDSSTESIKTDKIARKKKSDMVNRLQLANDNPDAIYVSIHLNKFTTSAASGAQVFYGVKNKKSEDLGLSIQNSIKTVLQPLNDRVIKKGTKSTYLLYNAENPAVIVECGFLSNTAELNMLKNKEYQSKVAFSVLGGINDFYEKGER